MSKNKPQLQYFLLYKPFNVLCQFTDSSNTKRTLAEVYPFPKNVYPVGRLDTDSEGLLILTNDKTLNHRLLNPQFAHKRTYWVQVEGIPTAEALKQLKQGVEIKVGTKMYRTKTAQVTLLKKEPNVPDRDPPIRFRQNQPTSWLELTLTEGKNRQVRKMTAKVGFPTLRLIRASIEGLTIEGMEAGQVLKVSKNTLERKVFLL
ncbi:MAG: pseudouridine synthase [Chitinophagales bacterium]